MPAEAEALLQRDAALRHEVNQLVAVRRLLALKRHEQPGPGSVDRCLRGVQARIEADGKRSFVAKIRAWFAYESPVPAYAYAAAALVFAAVGLAVFRQANDASPARALTSHEPAPLPVETISLVEESLLATNDAIVAAAEPAAIEKPIIMLRVKAPDAPAERGGLTFGGDTSVPVSYER